MNRSVNAYIRSQGAVNAAVNAVLNPALAWIGNRRMEFMPLAGGNSIVVDTAITCVAMPFLVALFVASGVQRARAAGELTADAGGTARKRLLRLLPERPWLLGLVLGVCIACFITPLVYGAFTLFELPGLPFPAFGLFKALYTAPVAYLVTCWVVRRQLLKKAYISNREMKTKGSA